MSISRFGNRINAFSTRFALAHKKHKMRDPTDNKKGKKTAKLAGRKEKPIQWDAREWLRIDTMIIAVSHSK